MATRSGRSYHSKRSYEPLCCGFVHRPGSDYGLGDQKLQELPPNSTFRRRSDTVTSLTELCQGQGIVTEDSGSERLLASQVFARTSKPPASS